MENVSVIDNAYYIADLIKDSIEVHNYITYKQDLSADTEAQSLLAEFQKKKEFFEECQKYGIFHPDYQSAKESVKEFEVKLTNVGSIQRFKEAEKELDDLLHTVSETIALAVSETIKVPSNDPLPKKKKKKEGPCGGF